MSYSYGGFTSVTSLLSAGTIGQLGYGHDADLLARSYVLQDASDVKPGYGVSYDVTNDSAKLYTTSATPTFLGVAFDDGSLPIENTAYSASGWPNMPVLRRGMVWVPISSDVDPTSTVYCQSTAGAGAKTKGSFRADNDGGNADSVSGAKFCGVFTAVGGKALLEINLPA